VPVLCWRSTAARHCCRQVQAMRDTFEARRRADAAAETAAAAQTPTQLPNAAGGRGVRHAALNFMHSSAAISTSPLCRCFAPRWWQTSSCLQHCILSSSHPQVTHTRTLMHQAVPAPSAAVLGGQLRQ
jgi:hypothetical protein